MYVCSCNNISSKDLEKDPFLIHKVGSKCGKCVERNQQVVCGNLSVLVEPEDRLPAIQMA